MPWKIFMDGSEHCVHKLNADGGKGEKIPGGCHASEEDAKKHLAALYANEPKELSMSKKHKRKVLVIEPEIEPEPVVEPVVEPTPEQQPVPEVIPEPVVEVAQDEVITEEDMPEEGKSLWRKLLDILCPKPAEKKEEPVSLNVNSSLVLVKDVNGNYHAIGIVTNKWRDRDANANPRNGGEIITEAAHKEFMEYLDAHPEEAPVLLAWHTDGTEVTSRAQWWAYKDGFVMMDWPLTEAEAQAIQKADKEFGPLGMSHGFITVEPKDVQNGLIHKYRSQEASHLPLKWAANIFTDFAVVRMEAKNMSKFPDEKRKYLAAVFGEETTSKLETETEERAKALEASGVQSKDYDAESPTTKALVSIAESLGKMQDERVQVIDAVKALTTRIEQLEKSDDEKIANAIKPKVSPVAQSEPGAQGTVISEDKAKELAPTGSENSWFAKAHEGLK